MAGRRPGRAPGPRTARDVIAVIVPVAVVANTGSCLLALWLQAEAATSGPPAPAWKVVSLLSLVTAQALWLVWWRRQPVGTAIASLLLWQAAMLVGGPQVVAVQPGVLLAVFGLAAETSGTARAAVVSGGAVIAAWGWLVSPMGHAVALRSAPADVAAAILLALGGVVLPALAGAWYARVRDRADRVADLAHQVVSGEAARTAEAVAAERRTLAHEIHDTSSAHLTAIITLSAAAREMQPPAELGALIAQIAADSRALYQSYERMLGSLQQEDRTATGAHRPGFRPGQHAVVELSPLVADYARATGREVAVTVHPDLAEIDRRLGPVRSHTAYRVVQEALNNARKHASGAPVSVALTDDGESLLLRIENGEPPGGPVGRTGADGKDAHGAGRPGLGLGIVGLRDRLVAAGGSLRTGPRSAGGWAVQALLPHPGRDRAPTASDGSRTQEEVLA